MKTSRKLILIAVFIIILMAAFSFTFFYFKNKGTFQIEIYNKTADVIGDFTISYQKNHQDILISGIPAKSYLKLAFKPGNAPSATAHGENSMGLSYRDQNNQIHKEVIFGYFERGYHGKAIIKILKVEADGVIDFEIKSDVRTK